MGCFPLFLGINPNSTVRSAISIDVTSVRVHDADLVRHLVTVPVFVIGSGFLIYTASYWVIAATDQFVSLFYPAGAPCDDSYSRLGSKLRCDLSLSISLVFGCVSARASVVFLFHLMLIHDLSTETSDTVMRLFMSRSI